jgi:hypothetical protein
VVASRWNESSPSLIIVGTTSVLLVGFKTFFSYYLVLVLPWITLLFACYVPRVLERYLPRQFRVALAASVLLVGPIAALAYAEVYFRTGHDHVSSPARIVSELRRGSGYLYSMYPSFGLASHRELYPWFNIVDSLIPRITGKLHDDDLIKVFSGSEDLVLYADELSGYAKASAYVRSNFRLVYEDAYYAHWTRRAVD